jgi:hypothetical protein
MRTGSVTTTELRFKLFDGYPYDEDNKRRLHRSACCGYQSQLPLHLRLPLLSSIVCVFPHKDTLCLGWCAAAAAANRDHDTARAGAIANVVHIL